VNITGWEFILLIVLAVVILGPERLPEYAARLGRFVRQAKAMAESAKGQLREQMGPEFDDINWQQYDPRQYDPRRIVREALLDDTPFDPKSPTGGNGSSPPGGAPPVARGHDPSVPTPYDLDAT
jgi:sec-independent protein translocase protein TatB